ncbi:MAG: tripartite tricarboxylate transporter substrate binding protein [Streptosporangiales bacterium]|nr:tripartite tricarboxylate transporter substrate binding protein [Streptosporangiales bacterium]
MITTQRPLRLMALALTAGLALTGCGAGGGQAGKAGAGGECDKAPNYPRGPVQLIVPWAAGGGTDSVARFFGTELSKALGEQVNVVNRTGGGGVIGHTAIAGGRPDGSTIGLATVEISMLHWQGLTRLDYRRLTPVAQVNADAAGITVRSDAPWKDAKDLVAEAKESPGELTASGTGRGGIWDLARAGTLLEAGAGADAIRWVPSEGAAPALQELVAGGIDISFASLVENRTMIAEGRVKPLAVMAPKRDPKFPEVPTLKEQGYDFETAAWRGIVGPAGMQQNIVDELSCHLDKIAHGPAYKSFLDKTGFGMQWRDAAAFGEFMKAQDAEKGRLMKAAGLAR